VRPHLLLLACGLASIVPMRALAQAETPTKPWRLTADLGLVNTAGNTSVTTVNARESFTLQYPRWGMTQLFSLLYARDSAGPTAEVWNVGLRGERRVGGMWRAYGLLTFQRNPFNNIDRRFEQTVGVLSRPIDTRRDSLEFDLGVAVAQEWTVADGERIDFGSGRFAVGFRHFFREKTYLLATALVLPGLLGTRNVRFNGELAVGAPLTEHLALKVSYALLYDNVPTAERDKVLDRFLTAAVQVRF
jgi:putative salt-induced outer membrane protein YdiY